MLHHLIRNHFQRPLVIQPNLPRLIEAVVKSLDPNAAGDREATIDAATEILMHVVQTFVPFWIKTFLSLGADRTDPALTHTDSQLSIST